MNEACDIRARLAQRNQQLQAIARMLRHLSHGQRISRSACAAGLAVFRAEGCGRKRA